MSDEEWENLGKSLSTLGNPFWNKTMINLIKELVKETGFILESNDEQTGEPISDEFVERFTDLLLEEVMQTLTINGHDDACDTLNKHFGFEE